MSKPGKITAALFARNLGGTGHLPPAEKTKLREARAARRIQAAMLAENERLAAAKARKAGPDEGANRQTDPVDPGFARPSNADDIQPPKPARAKAAK